MDGNGAIPIALTESTAQIQPVTDLHEVGVPSKELKRHRNSTGGNGALRD